MKNFAFIARLGALGCLATWLLAGCGGQPEAGAGAQNQVNLTTDKNLPAPAREIAPQGVQKKSQMDSMRAQDAAKSPR